MESQGAQRCRFEVTGFAGFEGEILRFRNANRPLAQTGEYLEWRYASLRDAPEPKVYWMHDGAGRPCGMAALIFRSFRVDNTLRHVAVLGDISLDSDMRGRGLGRSLLKFLTEDLDRNHPGCLAFVIPNGAAQRGLASAGWVTGGRLIAHVFMLNPEEKLRRALGSAGLARTIARPAAKVMASVARLHRKPGYALHVVDELDDAFDNIWQSLDKRRLILSEKSAEALIWRYVRHPAADFKFAKLHRHGQLAGYLVYQISNGSRECCIYDLVLPEQGDLGCMLALFVMRLADQGGVDSIRMLLNDEHPYGRQLWKIGFVPRDRSAVFQLYGRQAQAELAGCTWLLSQGDKDI